MNTEQTAQQLELAAQILRTGHPWERELSTGEWGKTDSSPVTMIYGGLKIRLVLATPPDNRPIHNPDNLTAEQVGVGYRLVCYDDKTTEDKLEKWMSREWVVVHTIGQLSFRHCQSTYRLPLSVPWPETKPDPYAELKKAHAEGKKMEYFDGAHWNPIGSPSWICSPNHYRIKPEAPPFQLPTPPPGMQWHRTDEWKEGDLPQGWRPLAKGEAFVAGKDGDEYRCWDGSFHWQKWGPSQGDTTHCRTRRPLTFTHAGKTWTWHRPGDPMPITHDKDIYFLRSDLVDLGIGKATSRTWDASLSPNRWIIGWRYADEKKTVPQSSIFFLPSTAIRFPKGSDHWSVVETLAGTGIVVEQKFYCFEELHKMQAMANRSIPLTGKWNPDAWEPCHKQIDA